MTWRSFWAGHQAFFRHMTMAAKVPAVVRMARAAVANGKCAVVGLQSTGEARTADVVADKGEELDDFVSGACLLPPAGLLCHCSVACCASLVTWGAFHCLERTLGCPLCCARVLSACLMISCFPFSPGSFPSHYCFIFICLAFMPAPTGPKELLIRLVENYYPLPPNPNALEEEAGESRLSAGATCTGTAVCMPPAAVLVLPSQRAELYA
jgi:hypothetical protein